MQVSALFALIPTLVFGLLAIYFSKKETDRKKKLLENEQVQKQQLYQVSILKEIQDRISYSLDSEKVIDVILGSLKNLFSYSTASSLSEKEGTLIFKAYVEEEVSHNFLMQVKTSMLASLHAIAGSTVPQKTEEHVTGTVLNDRNTKMPASFFHIPLIVEEKVVGLITIASTKQGLYKEQEMTILYQIVSQASNALSKLQELLASEKGKLLSMISSLSDGVFMVSPQNNELMVINKMAKTLLSITKEAPTMLDVLSSISQYYPLAEKLGQTLNLKQSINDKGVSLGDKTVEVIVQPVFEKRTGIILGLSVLLHDVTLEKNLATMKEDFTNIIVHELRAPLTAIKGASSLLLDLPAPKDSKDADTLVTTIKNESAKMLEEVSSLLDAARLESGRFVLQKTPSLLTDVILEKVSFFAAAAKEKHVAITTDLEHIPQFSFDPIRIGQVATNLLSNSLKFTQAGGTITITVRGGIPGRAPDSAQFVRSDSKTRTSTGGMEGMTGPRASDFVTVSVTDTGIGIPQDKQKQLFSKFYQVHDHETAKQYTTHSSGLGLYIVKGIVEAHDGSVSIQSKVGEGTTISFTLPR